jgi:hypothetical protein
MASGESRLSFAATLVFAGIVIEIATLYSGRPMAFVTFVAVAAPLQLAGVLLYLATWLTKAPE